MTAEMPTYVLDRVFDAPRELVLRAWTDPKLIPRWYGPGVESIVHRHELKPGGLWLHEMRWPGNAKYERIEFTEVTPPQRLAWLQATANAQWEPEAAPTMSDWPRTLATVVTFTADGARTRLKLTWTPHDATAAEVACFAMALKQLDKGWGAGMQLLEKLLAELQA